MYLTVTSNPCISNFPNEGPPYYLVIDSDHKTIINEVKENFHKVDRVFENSRNDFDIATNKIKEAFNKFKNFLNQIQFNENLSNKEKESAFLEVANTIDNKSIIVPIKNNINQSILNQNEVVQDNDRKLLYKLERNIKEIKKRTNQNY